MQDVFGIDLVSDLTMEKKRKKDFLVPLFIRETVRGKGKRHT